MLDFAFGCVFALGLVALSADQRRRERADFEWALGKARMTMTQAAQIMRLSHLSDLYKMLDGLNKLDGHRIAMMPPVFRSWYAIATLRRFGFPDEIHTAVKAQMVIDDLRKDD